MAKVVRSSTQYHDLVARKAWLEKRIARNETTAKQFPKFKVYLDERNEALRKSLYKTLGKIELIEDYNNQENP